ncbi:MULTISPECIES: bifunctional (p)ppGpp synthetase/guanosine-3',5'-bis(diphosphate) 3'-pyrophosphohydrolase [unclassified Enterococcus]|uniref:RelA/SpoT family protein n=1 Tax=unclassified Enterococcus TaxID=2608891 RepID=UPI001552BF0D|nr:MULTISPECIES: bifunctional (p)ppGpp synthetase/guanosine-3',5'-bis(diphosphate) 3'-pyrophosphohydrolase [unclassified Enterococcus]MBS7578200.1 bifunctional (p)ppGpp synthetase/guanosine-3',5'-bis(diphosphate) 3'-pyrophosphohydrolase [Enterococcus sp. MMGLQ5-2]MBS7585424.1 bifunctional (p)ppGpp synthetase/guanosine-3',5'-bis(diphosphate) 3'-pyrophosphohydrolase [Enterococcus sp. MMGLQ5-1]NPD13281.1 bifunctional (p)ppGpp synthetase/guanosine-3',5'-bis(diphosphate) 3'-pyrophosphohydrolase [Ente
MPKEVNITGEGVVSLCQRYMNPEDIKIVKHALDYATNAHSHQTRKSGEPYIIHPIQVAGILAELRMDAVTVACGFLHDVVEDTDVTNEQLAIDFSPEIAQIVEGVTKIGKVEYKSHEEQQAETHQKMLLAMVKDLRVIMVKLADRLHNMRTLKHLRPDKQQRISRETLEIYAPIADRLGINRIKWELEDTSLRYLEPKQYYRIVHLMKNKRSERERIVDTAIEKLRDKTEENGIYGDIYGRPKHIYSIYRKMKDQKKRFEELYDLLAIRCIVETKGDCYAVLGYVHDIWNPMSNRFKDYIAAAKANGYQSLHTTVIGPEGQPLEIQIRTTKMHEVAEYGVAAHWAYKQGKGDKNEPDIIEKQLNFLKTELLEIKQESNDALEFIDSVKGDVLSSKVYVNSPKGAVIELPKGSGPLDFAYAVHTQVGDKATGAKVNGRMVTFDYKLKTGDRVEIITSSNSFGPSRDWLKFVKTTKARNKIKRFFKVQDRELSVNKGRDLLKNFLLDHDFVPNQFMDKKHIAELLPKLNYKNEDDLMAAIGFGEISPVSVGNKLTHEERKRQARDKEEAERMEISKVPIKKEDTGKMKVKTDGGAVIQGVNNLLIRLAKCCNPVPGDEIVGYITKGRGVSIHRTDCPNIANQENVEARLVEVEWEEHSGNSKIYKAELDIYAVDKPGLFNEVYLVVSNFVKNVISVNAYPAKDRKAMIHIAIPIQDKEELTMIVDKIKMIPDVISVKRTNG